jgi:hypothetical protein
MAIHKDLSGDEAIHEIMYVQNGDPGAVGAGKFWLDTTGGATLTAGAILKQRDAPDTGWTTRADVKTALDLKAALASPALTGTPTAPTASPGTNNTQIATTEYVDDAVSAVSGGDGPVFRSKVEPVNGDFAWVNQGSATLTTTEGLALVTPAEATQIWRMRTKAIPSSPFTLTVWAEQRIGADFNLIAPIILRESGSGDLICFGAIHNTTVQLVVTKKTAAGGAGTTDAGDYTTNTSFGFGRFDPVFWRLTADATNYTWSVSRGGREFFQIHQATKADFLTADEIGFGAAAISAGTAAGIRIVSWEEA